MKRLRGFASDTFSSLSIRPFRTFIVGQFVSQLGYWMQLVALSLLVLRLTDSGVWLGVLACCQFLPTLLLGTWGGVVCDRLDKRRLLFTTQSALLCTAATLGILVLLDRISLAMVLVLTTCSGIAKVFDDPPRRTLPVELVGSATIANAIGLNSAVFQLSRVVGPAFAAAVIAGAGIGWCFMANAVSYIAVLLSIALMGPPAFPASRVARADGQIREALRYVWGNRHLRVTLSLTATLSVLSFTWQVTLPLVATRVLEGGDSAYAVLASMMGFGALCGSLLIARRAWVDEHFLARAAVAYGCTMLALMATTHAVVAAATVVPLGLTGFLLLAGSQSALQLCSVPSMRGRVMALFGVFVIGVIPIGGLLSGWLADRFGTRVALGVGGVGAIGSGLVVLGARRRQLLTELRPVRSEATPAAQTVPSASSLTGLDS